MSCDPFSLIDLRRAHRASNKQDWHNVAFCSPFLSKDFNRYKSFSGNVTII